MGIRDTRVCNDNSPHLHRPSHPAEILFHGPVLTIEGFPVALVLDEVIANRMVVLLARHGLADIPESPDPGWPAPSAPALSFTPPERTTT